MTKTAIFDLDGTLTDPKLGICGCVQYALAELGAPVPSMDDLEWVIGPPMIESLKQLVGPERAAEGLRLYRLRYGDIGLTENRLYDGIADMLGGLQAGGWRLLVATSKAEPYAIRIIEHFGLARFFERVYGSGLDGSLLHKNELLAHVRADAGVAPEKALMIGDRKFDVLGAAANGLRTVGVTWGYGSRAELTEAGAVALVERPGEVEAALVRLLG